MPTQHFNQPALIAQKTKAETIEFVLSDGVHFDEAIGEHVIVVGGQIVNYAFHWSTGLAQFKEACRVRREHFASNPAEVQRV